MRLLIKSIGLVVNRNLDRRGLSRRRGVGFRRECRLNDGVASSGIFLLIATGDRERKRCQEKQELNNFQARNPKA